MDYFYIEPGSGVNKIVHGRTISIISLKHTIIKYKVII